MELLLIRDFFASTCCTGTLAMDGKFFCYTLEDTDRKLEDNPGAKEYGKTAIPRGRYQVIIDYSNRFKRELPRLLDVPGFVGIRIHPGNTAADTEGCILVGSARKDCYIANSRFAFNKLYHQMDIALSKGQEVWITVQ